MIDRTALLRDLKPQLRLLEDDLLRRSAEVPEFAETLHLEWDDAKQSNRTAATYETWLDDRVTQSAVAWILATIFIRFCEDNGLIDLPVIAGPGDRLAIAGERQNEFIAENPASTDRDWIGQGIKALSVSKVAAGLFDEAHNPMWTVTPSHDAAQALLAFWRRRAESGQIVHDFTEPDWNTRFLGDLYQDLSDHAKKTYALLQTPEFVEEFILDYTLTPAIQEFGLTPAPPEARPDLPSLLRVIDPTCGSGHFLLGAFHRLLDRWEKEAPDLDRWEQITRALSSVHGVDKNPFAAAIARFRLLIAVMKVADKQPLVSAPDFPINVAVGDSLLHGRGGPGIQIEFDLMSHSGWQTHTYVIEDILDYSKSVDMLGLGSYHVVVGNPPYITVKDQQESDNYRKAYSSCSGKYALAVPFAERFFQLARQGDLDRRGSGYVGQITANSFMKREFGKKLIEEFFQKVDLTHIVDTSGAYIPGHGTPTLILMGRCRLPRPDSTIRTVLGVQGEPEQPDVPAKGLVWTAIMQQIGHPGSASQWVAVTHLPRQRFAGHPWSLSGGGSRELLNQLNSSGHRRIKDFLADPAGFAAFSANDEAFNFPVSWHSRHNTPSALVRQLVAGKDIKSWAFESETYAIAPYDEAGRLVPLDTYEHWARHLWVVKRGMAEPDNFSGRKRGEFGVPWWSWYRWIARRNSGGPRLIIAAIATHNEHYSKLWRWIAFRTEYNILRYFMTRRMR
jgi:hypothetical protein